MWGEWNELSGMAWDHGSRWRVLRLASVHCLSEESVLATWGNCPNRAGKANIIFFGRYDAR